MRVSILRPATDRARIEKIWRELEEIRRPRYFLTWAWMEAWLDWLPEELVPNLVVVSDPRTDAPLAAFFLRIADERRHGLLSSRIGYVNESGDSEYDLICIEFNGILARRDVTFDVASVLRQITGWDELVLNRLDNESVTARLLARGLDDFKVSFNLPIPSPYVDLDAVRASKEGYLALIGSGTRSAIRRSKRLYEGRGKLSLEIADDVATAKSILDEIAALSLRRFDGRQAPSSFQSNPFKRFHHTLIERRFHTGELQLLRMRAGSQLIGCAYNFIHDGVVHFYQSGLTYEADNKFKPGLVLHASAIEHAARSPHLHMYDFLGSNARYKQDLATAQNYLVTARVQKRMVKFALEDRARHAKHWSLRKLAEHRVRQRVQSLGQGIWTFDAK